MAFSNTMVGIAAMLVAAVSLTAASTLGLLFGEAIIIAATLVAKVSSAVAIFKEAALPMAGNVFARYLELTEHEDVATMWLMRLLLASRFFVVFFAVFASLPWLAQVVLLSCQSAVVRRVHRLQDALCLDNRKFGALEATLLPLVEKLKDLQAMCDNLDAEICAICEQCRKVHKELASLRPARAVELLLAVWKPCESKVTPKDIPEGTRPSILGTLLLRDWRLQPLEEKIASYIEGIAKLEGLMRLLEREFQQRSDDLKVMEMEVAEAARQDSLPDPPVPKFVRRFPVDPFYQAPKVPAPISSVRQAEEATAVPSSAVSFSALPSSAQRLRELVKERKKDHDSCPTLLSVEESVELNGLRRVEAKERIRAALRGARSEEEEATLLRRRQQRDEARRQKKEAQLRAQELATRLEEEAQVQAAKAMEEEEGSQPVSDRRRYAEEVRQPATCEHLPAVSSSADDPTSPNDACPAPDAPAATEVGNLEPTTTNSDRRRYAEEVCQPAAFEPEPIVLGDNDQTDGEETCPAVDVSEPMGVEAPKDNDTDDQTDDEVCPVADTFEPMDIDQVDLAPTLEPEHEPAQLPEEAEDELQRMLIRFSALKVSSELPEDQEAEDKCMEEMKQMLIRVHKESALALATPESERHLLKKRKSEEINGSEGQARVVRRGDRKLVVPNQPEDPEKLSEEDEEWVWEWTNTLWNEQVQPWRVILCPRRNPKWPQPSPAQEDQPAPGTPGSVVSSEDVDMED